METKESHKCFIFIVQMKFSAFSLLKIFKLLISTLIYAICSVIISIMSHLCY